MTTHQPTAHYHRSQQQELATALVLVGGDSQDARAIHGSSRSAMVHPSSFVLNGLRSSSWPLRVDATDRCCLRDLMMMMMSVQDYCKSNQPISLKLDVIIGLTRWKGWRSGLVVGRRTCDLGVASSRPGRDAAAQQP